ncbi:MAG: DNA methyltransferase, partial [Planctomycetaceae bacterium]
FLMRCLFTMFAEDVEIGGFTKGAFARFLESRRGKLDTFVPMLEDLWRTMDAGGFSTILEGQLKQFNGGLFEDHTALPLNADQLELLIEAATAEWQDVEPAIFGTLLERALDPHERHKLGAHYTPRAYVERLVMPTIIEPLRAEWETAYAVAVALDETGKRADARKTVREFHEKLCETRVLDPACGSGNFLYVALELMKRLEGEVLKSLRDFGEKQLPLLTIDPHQFLGIEVNPRAAAITDLVLWIGYLQWHFRTRGNDPLNEPIIRKFHNIECRDAVLAWDAIEPVVDEEGNPVTRWDGRTTKPHSVTGNEVPDETARVQEVRYVNPRKAEWPQADYVVGNPPFIGNSRMREALGDGYAETIRATYSELPESCDYVMYWWHKAAELTRLGEVIRFGFIATNSLRQTFNRRIVAPHLDAADPLSIGFAIPDHPWVDSADGAAVRISMTVGAKGAMPGNLLKVTREYDPGELGATVVFVENFGRIHSNLAIGPDVSSAVPLEANANLSCPGVKLHGAGFIVTPEEAATLGLGRIDGLELKIRQYRNGRDIASRPRNVMVIDLFGLSADTVRSRFPEVFQHVFAHVKPERDQNNRASYRENWWIFGEPRSAFRPALAGLPRFITTGETAKHRAFLFLDASILPDNMLINVALDDAYFLGVLSSRFHVTWALATGGRLGVGNNI